jgi:hypothetical protein
MTRALEFLQLEGIRKSYEDGGSAKETSWH